MPQVRDSNSSGSDALEQASPKIQVSEVGDFLAFLFFDVARRPAELNVRECIRVARYLDWLTQGGVPQEVLSGGDQAIRAYRLRGRTAEEEDEMRSAEQIANLLWGRVRSHNKHKAASNGHALRFLREHAMTHLTGPFIDRTLDLLVSFDVPPDLIRPVTKPYLVSRSLAAYGGNPRLQDDLSERIYAADHTLKRAGVGRTRTKIAKFLNEAKIKRGRARDCSDMKWLEEDVNDRVKAFEKTFTKRRAKPDPERIRGTRDRIVDRWINSFRLDCQSL